MSYPNVLHGSAGSQQSGYSIVAQAVCASPAGARFRAPNRRRVPQAVWSPPPKWRQAMGPTKVYSPILFDIAGYQFQGVPMRELVMRGQHGLEQMIGASTDLVLQPSGLQKITLRILWTGYEHLDWARSIELDLQGPTTRTQLAMLVAQQIARFMERCRNEPGLNPHWTIGPNGIRFDHTILVGLFHVCADVWQADIAVDFR